MSSQQSIADFILDQIAEAGEVSARKMFGEYCVYCGDKPVALICDDRLFVKITAAGLAFAGKAEEAPPYSGAKPHLLVSAGQLEDRQWLTKLIQVTAAALPEPKKRQLKKR